MDDALTELESDAREREPRHASFLINPNRIGQVVGSGGKNLQNSIQDQHQDRAE